MSNIISIVWSSIISVILDYYILIHVLTDTLAHFKSVIMKVVVILSSTSVITFCSWLFALFLCFKLSPFVNERQVKCHYSCSCSSASLSAPTRLLVGIVSRDKQLSALPEMPLHTKDLSTEMHNSYVKIISKYIHTHICSSRSRKLIIQGRGAFAC